MRLIDADRLKEEIVEAGQRSTRYRIGEFWELNRGEIWKVIDEQPTVQPETATVTIGRTKGSVTMWYECDACGEPIDQKDCYCRNCGRKLKYE